MRFSFCFTSPAGLTHNTNSAVFTRKKRPSHFTKTGKPYWEALADAGKRYTYFLNVSLSVTRLYFLNYEIFKFICFLPSFVKHVRSHKKDNCDKCKRVVILTIIKEELEELERHICWFVVCFLIFWHFLIFNKIWHYFGSSTFC